MTTFRDLRIALLDSYMDGEIDDDEFLVLWQVYQSKNPDFPYEDYGKFSLDEMDETECRAEFRFRDRPPTSCPRLGDSGTVYLCPANSM